MNYLLDHQFWHMYHEVHLWYDVNIWIEFTKFMMVIINKTNKVDRMVFRCHWRKK